MEPRPGWSVWPHTPGPAHHVRRREHRHTGRAGERLVIHRRYIRLRRSLGLGYPVLPDQLVTAAGIPESFSPQTPDATMMQILQGQNQQLPPDLAAKWAAAQAAPVPTPAVTPSGAPVSTQ